MQALKLIEQVRPDAVISMGGFTAAPVILSASRRGIACFTHQLDLEPGFANRLIVRRCGMVTTSFEYAQRPFGRRVDDEPCPTPVRYALAHLPSRDRAARRFDLSAHRPVVLVYGGGQGAQALNELVERHASEWLEWTQLLHVTGIAKGRLARRRIKGYVTRELLDEDEMRAAHALADLEIIRGGIGSLSEVAALKKAAIVLPIPNSHQEANAQAFEAQGAVVICDQGQPQVDQDVLSTARLLMDDAKERKHMGERAHAFFTTDNGAELARRILLELKRA
jgi:UDP-N-acetylglucosamine--N-acetylmuramyl-(pentapeptide) pyrophosphoryl-undecaprenol N-acetylglucosamine transferase